MRIFLCSTVLTTVFLGALGFPADPKLPQVNGEAASNNQKQPKQSSLFGVGFDYNLSKNSSLIPIPSFLNLNANYENGGGATGNLIVPLALPLSLLFPPLNLNFGINANKNVSVGINALSTGASASTVGGEVDVDVAAGGSAISGGIDVSAGIGVGSANGGGSQADASGWGWSTTPPPGWGWNPSTTQGWTTTTPGWTTTTPGWQPPPGWASSTEGWTTTTPPPTTTQGWTPPPTTTEGWTPPPTTTTPGWSPPPPGWKGPESSPAKVAEKRKAPVGPSKPEDKFVEKPKPQGAAKPIPQISENLQSSPDKGNEAAQTYIVDVAQSSVSSELPSIPLTEQALAAAAAQQASVHHENEVNSDSHPYFSIMEVDNNNVFMPENPVSQDVIPSDLPNAQYSIQPLNPNTHNPINYPGVRISVPIAPFIGSKARRHAGVEMPASLRIEDFEDVEGPHPLPENPVVAEQIPEEEEISKEELILMAMEQISTNLPAGVQVNLNRPGKPAGLLGNINSNSNAQTQSTVTYNKPEALAATEHHDFSESDFADKEDDSSEDESDATKNIEKEDAPEEEVVSKVIPKNPEPSVPERPGKNKPRPYGMDRPSKNKPHSDSGIKNEQFGLPHYTTDLQQKEQESELLGTNIMGFQIPNIKWSSFSDIFQHFMGSRHKKTGMGKSDAAVPLTDEKCVDDEDDEIDGVRSQVIHAGGLCATSGKGAQCHDACRSKGFSGGTCLGPASTPGCLCKLPNHKEYGMMLNPLTSSEQNVDKDLQESSAPTCKKCDCESSCKNAGAFTGFCMGKCHCANPWYTKV